MPVLGGARGHLMRWFAQAPVRVIAAKDVGSMSANFAQ